MGSTPALLKMSCIISAASSARPLLVNLPADAATAPDVDDEVQVLESFAYERRASSIVESDAT